MGKTRDTLISVARRLKGTLSLDHQEIKFRVNDIPARLTFYDNNIDASYKTSLRFELSSPDAIRIFPKSAWAAMKEWFGTNTVLSGDTKFDNDFCIQGSNSKWIRKVLTPTIRSELRVISGLNIDGDSGVIFDVGPSGLTLLLLPSLNDKEDELINFIRRASRILKEMLTCIELPGSFGTIKTVLDQGSCPVCVTAFKGEIKYCSKCNTPHHSECWEYFKGCSLFACGSRNTK